MNTPKNINRVAVLTNAGDQTLETISIDTLERLAIQVKVEKFPLAAFKIQVRFHASGDYITLYSAAGNYTAPAGLLIGASGDLTTQAVGSGWFIMDVRALESVRVLARSGDAAGSTVTLYGRGI
ncbi:hypothetical protein [Nitrosovibrio tenuis]|uniref:Uncharacterized protein n=1 Tax=Nitrosovibrio tenuis TaxID=1233 RepID=A0A1H7IET0_9PROT|nr:hypothetical protein [Nitrosovibrio tenuis]SEK60948.1 hypothetical protein SAMN05216387_102148 [Nitrosovibrio tenuis]